MFWGIGSHVVAERCMMSCDCFEIQDALQLLSDTGRQAVRHRLYFVCCEEHILYLLSDSVKHMSVVRYDLR